MNEIRYRLPSSKEGTVSLRNDSGEAGGGGGGKSGGSRDGKDFHIDYQNLNWILETRDLIEKEEGQEAAHKVIVVGDCD